MFPENTRLLLRVCVCMCKHTRVFRPLPLSFRFPLFYPFVSSSLTVIPLPSAFPLPPPPRFSLSKGRTSEPRRR